MKKTRKVLDKQNYPMEVSYGDVFYADLNPVIGSEQAGVRPVLIIQNDTGNLYSKTTICVAIATYTKNKKAGMPTHVYIDCDKFSLARKSIVMMEHIRTIDKTRLRKKIGSFDDEMMAKVKTALRISINL